MISSITASLRFDGALNVDLQEFQVVHHKCNFLVMIARVSDEFGTVSAYSLSFDHLRTGDFCGEGVPRANDGTELFCALVDLLYTPF